MKKKAAVLKPRWNKVLADLWDNKTRTLLVVASIAVGVFAIGTIANGYKILSADLDASYAAVNPANVEIVTDLFDQNFLDSVLEVPGVLDVEGRHRLNVNVVQENTPLSSMDLIAINDFAGSKIKMIEPYDGQIVAGENEVLIGYEPLNDSGYRVGDVLPVQIEDGTIRQLPVMGLIIDQTEGNDFVAPTIGYISMDSLEWLGQPELYNRLYVTVRGDRNDDDHILSIAEQIEDKLEKSGRQVYRTTTYRSDAHPFASMSLAMFGVMGALGVLVMLLSSSLIVNTLNALITQHLRQIGVMKLIGARSFQILLMYLILILLYSVVALIIAVPLSMIAGYSLAELMAGLMNAHLQEFRMFPDVVVLQILIALLVPLIAGFFPVRSGSKITVRRAISSDGQRDRPTISSFWEHLGSLLRWVSRPILLSIRNTFRRKGRLALTLFTLTVAGAIFIAVFNVRVSMQAFIDQLSRHFIADITLEFEQPYRISKVEQAVFQIPGVEAVEAWSGTIAEVLGADGSVEENLLVLAPPSDSNLLDPDILVGRWLLPGDDNAIVVSDAIYDTYPDLEPGDTMRLKVAGKREDDWTVVGVFRFMNFIGDPLSYAPYETISRLQNLSNEASSYRLVIAPDASQEEVGADLDNYLRSRGFKVGNVTTGDESSEQSTQMVNILVIFLLIMALLTAAVGSIGLTGTMGMNVLERTREIGVMRAIGAVDFAIIKSVVVEGAFIGLISWAVSVVLSFPISLLLLKIISDAMINAPIALALTIDGVLMWLGVVLALSVFASVIPARNAARLTIREVLAYE